MNNQAVAIITRRIKEIADRNLGAHLVVLNEMKRSDPVTKDGDALDSLYRNPTLSGERMRIRMMKFEDALYNFKEEIKSSLGDMASSEIVTHTINSAFNSEDAGAWVALAEMSNVDREAEYNKRHQDTFQANSFR